MSLHHGKIIEKVIRRNGFAISKLADAIGVNRRSVYYWFNQRQLKPDLIVRIGKALNYDFSAILPGTGLRSEDFNNPDLEQDDQTKAISIWKDKYLKLLERYNALLVNAASLRKGA
jgi:transcriptional regulator with XRE-family HTH domain